MRRQSDYIAGYLHSCSLILACVCVSIAIAGDDFICLWATVGKMCAILSFNRIQPTTRSSPIELELS